MAHKSAPGVEFPVAIIRRPGKVMTLACQSSRMVAHDWDFFCDTTRVWRSATGSGFVCRMHDLWCQSQRLKNFTKWPTPSKSRWFNLQSDHLLHLTYALANLDLEKTSIVLGGTNRIIISVPGPHQTFHLLIWIVIIVKMSAILVIDFALLTVSYSLMIES